MQWSEVRTRDDILLYLVTKLHDDIDKEEIYVAGVKWKPLLGYYGTSGTKHMLMKTHGKYDCFGFHVGDTTEHFPNYGTSRSLLGLFLRVADEYQQRFL